MEFEWSQADILDGELIYSEGDYAIDFEFASVAAVSERIGSKGHIPLAFSTLTLEVGIETGELLFPRGYFPRTSWQVGPLKAPLLQQGRVTLLDRQGLYSGVAERIPGSADWSIVWDELSGWIRFGEATVPSNADAVEYAKNAVIVISDKRVLSLWLRPKIVK